VDPDRHRPAVNRVAPAEPARKRYAELAATAAEGASCCTPDEQAVFGTSRYADDDLDVIPDTRPSTL